MNSLLSVVMPTYNGERFVAAALESVRAQADQDIEILIIDDGSTDTTREIVREYSTVLPIRLIATNRVGNWVAVTNLGLREAKGEWACFLHQDDLWLPGRIARLRNKMENSEHTLILHDSIFIGPDGQSLGPWTCPLHEGIVQPEEFVEHLLVQNFIAIPSPVFRRSAAIRSGGLDETLWHSADWDLWLRLGKLGQTCFIAERLTAFRIHPASQTVARQLLANEWERQLSTVLSRHLPSSTAPNFRLSVARAAMASIAVNSALSSLSRGERVNALAVIRQILMLGPLGWHRYFRDSRILQRVRSRLKVRGLTGLSSDFKSPTGSK